jgi:Fe-S oxidoreductase
MGNDLVFQTLAEANLETMKQSKVQKVVTICPHCVRTIGLEWKEFGEPPAVEHHSEFMARHAARLPSNGMRVKMSCSTTPATWAAIAGLTTRRAR